MPKRQITTLPTGNVLVVTFDPSGQPSSREYTRRGPCVYVLQDHGPRLPACAELRPHGVPLQLRRGESLEQTIRRALQESEQNNARLALTLWDVAFAGLFAGCGAALAGLALLALAALALAVLAGSVVAGLAAELTLMLAAAGLLRLWREFPQWHWLLAGAAALAAIGMVAVGLWLTQQPYHWIR